MWIYIAHCHEVPNALLAWLLVSTITAWGSEITSNTNILHCCPSLSYREHSTTVLFDQSVCPSWPRFTLFSSPVDCSFQHLSEQITYSNHTAKILELADWSWAWMTAWLAESWLSATICRDVRIGQRVQNWLSCAELTKWRTNCKILLILFWNIALSSALTAATASTKHLGVKVIKQNSTKKRSNAHSTKLQ